MTKKNTPQDPHSTSEADQELIRAFKKFPNPVPIYLFSVPGKNDVFTDTARKTIHLFGQLSDKIIFHDFYIIRLAKIII